MYDPASPITPDGQISAAALRQMAEGAAAPQAYMIGGSSCMLVTGQGTVNVPIIDPSTPLTKFVVVREDFDYLACIPFTQPLSGTPDATGKPNTASNQVQPYFQGLPGVPAPGALINVAKPYILQFTPWEGKLVNIDGQTTRIDSRNVGGIGFRGVAVLSQGPGVTLGAVEGIAGGALVAGTTYLYLVTAVVAGAERVLSNIVPFTPAAPNLSAALTWTASPGVDSYNVYRSLTSTFLDFAQIASGLLVEDLIDTGLTPGSGLTGPAAALTPQQITPSYMPGDVITAAPLIVPYIASFNSPVSWMDVNEGGRIWAESAATIYPCGAWNQPPPLLFASVNLAQVGGIGTASFPIFSNGGPTWSGGRVVYNADGTFLGAMQVTMSPEAWKGLYNVEIALNEVVQVFTQGAGCGPPFTLGVAAVVSITADPPADLLTGGLTRFVGYRRADDTTGQLTFTGGILTAAT